MGDERKTIDYRPFFFPNVGGSVLQSGPFSAHPSHPPLSAHKPLRGLWLVVGKCELGERGWKLCTEVKGSVGWVRTEVGDPRIP
jgi:hypothetical protein